MTVPRRHSSDLVVFLCCFCVRFCADFQNVAKQRAFTNKRLKSNWVQGLMETRYYSRKMAVYSSEL